MPEANVDGFVGAEFSGALDSAGRPHGEGSLTIPKSHDGDGRANQRHAMIKGVFNKGVAVGSVEAKYQDWDNQFETYSGSVAHDFSPKGKGIFTSNIGFRIVGVFEQDLSMMKTTREIRRTLKGKGRYESGNGRYSLDGEFDRGGLPNGQVVITYDGNKFVGKMISPHLHDLPDDQKGIAAGEMHFADGRIYQGEYAFDARDGGWVIPDGQGRMKLPNGEVQIGDFIGDEYLGPTEEVRAKRRYSTYRVPGAICVAERHLARLVPPVSLILLTGLVAIWQLQNADPNDLQLFSVESALLLILAGLVFRLLLRLRTEKYTIFAVTKNHVVFRTGVFSRREVTVPLDKALVVELNKSIWGRLLGYGDVTAIHEGTIKAEAKSVRNADELLAATTRISK